MVIRTTATIIFTTEQTSKKQKSKLVLAAESFMNNIGVFELPDKTKVGVRVHILSILKD